jgi:hypothetical protein
MAAAELVFQSLPITNPAELVFGETAEVADAQVTLAGTLPALTFSASVNPSATVALAGTLPGLTLSAQVGTVEEVALNGTLPGLTLSAQVAKRLEVEFTGTLPSLTFAASVAEPGFISLTGTLPGLTLTANAVYDSNTDRPIVGQVSAAHEVASHGVLGVTSDHQSAGAQPIGWQTILQPAADVRSGTQVSHQRGKKLDNPAMVTGFERAKRTSIWPKNAPFTDAVRLRQTHKSSFQEGVDLRSMRYFDFQDMQRGRRPSRRTRWQPANVSSTGLINRFQKALRKPVGFDYDFQAARPPNGNNYVPPVEPPFDPCYLPDPHLVYKEGFERDSALVFICERHSAQPPTPTTVVVPIRSVYVVINNVSLRRVVGNITLPTLSLSMSIDAGSWTWGFQASLPADTLDELQPGGSGPVELEANINGNLYRVLVEQISRDRSFGSSSIRVSGRGKTALLSSPYAPVLTFANSQQRTAQQLMADVLTFNGVPLAWSVDWQLTDWPVPAGVFNVTGTYIEGLTAIAGAAGAYLQPHPTSQELSVLLKYPVAPWEWNTVTPDFELPASITVQEGIEWLEKPDYNRVFVSGTSAGVLGQVTRTGSGGTLPAQMVTDALITHVDAARQRGLSILGDTGKQAKVRLRLPVLPETGIISPGNFVRYVDGLDTRLGLVRSTSVDAGWPEVWQSIELETHL